MQYALENGMIDLAYVREQIEMNKRKEVLDKHPYSIWEGKDGKWYTKFPDETKGKVLKKRKTKEEIENLICDFWKKKSENPTLQDIFDMWIDKKLEYKEVQKGSADRYETDFIRFFVKSGFSKRHIKQITEEELETFVKTQISQNNLTHKTFSGLRIIIKGMFRFAKKKGWTTISISDFFETVDISRNSFAKKIQEKENEVLAEEEIPILVDYLKHSANIWDLGVLLVLQTGLRVGEMSSLKKDDWADNVLRIRRTEVRQKNSDGKNTLIVRNFTKSQAGMRDIILTEGGVSTLKAILKINPYGAYLFEHNGKRIRGNTFNKHLDIVLKKLGLKHRSIHKLRKTYCTMLINAGCDDALIMSQLGHSSIETSRKYYYFSNRSAENKKKQIESAIAI